MKTVSLTIKTLVILGIISCIVGVSSVSATRAITDKDTGCYVRTGPDDDDYALDEACTNHSVLKMGDDEEFEFFVYQDHGQSSWHPSEAFRNTFEQCINFEFGTVCGTVKESVSPSGEYKSSFKSH